VQSVNDMSGHHGMAAFALQARQMADGAKNLLTSAQAGGFGFRPEAADAMITALRDSIDELDTLSQHVAIISQAPKLGRTPAAQVVGPFTLHVATDDQGVAQALRDFRQTMVDMATAYEEAKKHYNASEIATADHFQRLAR
jgi:hypothetical protein